jgi:hypothetical protein
MVKALKEAGIQCYKTSDRFSGGVPDIYIAGGNWIETKKVPLGGLKGNYNILRSFATSQLEFAKRYTRAGDLVVFFIIFYDPKHGAAQNYLLAPYQFCQKYRHWTVGRVKEWCYPTYNEINFRDIFDPKGPRYRNEEGIREFTDLIGPEEV